MRVMYPSCHLTSSPQNTPVSLSTLQSIAFTTFALICVDELSIVATYLRPPEPRNICSLLVSKPLHLSRSTGAKTQSYRSLSTGRPVSSTGEENLGFHDKFGLQKVGSVKPTLHFHIYTKGGVIPSEILS